ncbi:MAG: carboxymuconolactone decarboxylase family protein [Spirochaetes bacterium]|nr:carboxymuconolactone decarboxylase family protein [Spirochaetota bacterium]
MKGFGKRTYTVAGLWREVMAVAGRGRVLLAAIRPGPVSDEFRERIMLAVTGVNRCRYCSYLHSRMALRAGVSEAEVREIAQGEFGGAPEGERTALLYAEHWADTGGNPEREPTERLRETYGERGAEIITMHIRLIMIGNRLGNTWESLTMRLRGRPAAQGFFLQETAVLSSWLLLLPAALARLLVSLATGL